MAQKCVHKGCGKFFSNPEEECVYHPGPPVFHEGQKGVWAPSNGLIKSLKHWLTPWHRLEMLQASFLDI